MRAAKRTAYLSAGHPMADAYDRAEESWVPVYRSADAQAFRDERTPVWTGR